MNCRNPARHSKGNHGLLGRNRCVLDEKQKNPVPVSRFANIERAAPSETFDLAQAFNKDRSSRKVNLGVDAYRTDDGEPWVMPVVRQVEEELAKDYTLNKESLPEMGLRSFSEAATSLLLGPLSPAIFTSAAFGIQTVGGTGSLRVAAEFLARNMGYSIVYSSQPAWEGYSHVFLQAGFEAYLTYRYWDAENKVLDLQGMLKDLKGAPENSVIILQACAHNPTGVDPSEEEWKKIAKVIKEMSLFPLFDAAFLGFASGDPETDAWPVRYFVDQEFELLCCQSFSKDFGLYNEGVGNLTIICNDQQALTRSLYHITKIIQGLYGDPPDYGGRIVATILNDRCRKGEWMDCIKTMANRLRSMRRGLVDRLTSLGTPGNWDYILTNMGMYLCLELRPEHVKYLRHRFHIYMSQSGRINIAGLTPSNLDYVASAINDILTLCM